MSQKAVINTSPDILGGAPVFAGTRVAVGTFFEYLEAGDSLDRFLQDFPTVTREQAQQLLELSREAVIGHRDEATS